MGLTEIIGAIATIGGAVWGIAEKINNLHRCLDQRLDKVEAHQIEIENTVHRNRDKIDAIEKENGRWFSKIHKDLYKCTTPPPMRNEGGYPVKPLSGLIGGFLLPAHYRDTDTGKFS